LLALRADKQSVSVRAAPPLGTAPCPGYWWECRQEARVLGQFGLRAAPASGRGRPWLERVSFNSPPAPALAPPTPCGCAGRIATGSAVAVSGSGDHHGSLASVGVTWHAETKNPPRGGHFGSLGAGTPWTSGNRFGGTVLPKHLPSLRHDGACIKQIPSDPCYRWLQPLALWRVSRDWIQELLSWGRCGRAERGDSANSPNAQRRTSAQVNPRAGMRKQA